MMAKHYKIIALMGQAGSGKDRLLKESLKAVPDLNEIISCTTRPPREGEVHGKNYYFLSNEEFAQKVINFEMLEATSFRDWFYGTSIDALSEDKVNIGVFNPDGIYALLESPNVEVCVYWVNANPKTRLMRQLQREENPDVNEIIRRYGTDEKDFSDISFTYTKLDNETYDDIGRAVAQIAQNIELDKNI